MRDSGRFALLTALVSVLALPVFATDWPQWRGPFFNGSSDERDLPTSWGPTQGIAWVSPLPGPSGATPVISNGRVFVSSMVKATPEFVALCFDAGTGKQLWRRDVGSDARRYPRNNMVSPSPAADGQRVFFLFGEGSLVAFDFEGRQLWSRNIEKEYGNLALQFGYSNSPVLYDGRPYVTVIRRDRPYREPRADGPLDSFLLALDPATGRNLWKQPRRTDAFDEGMETYMTPVPFIRNGKVELLATGGDFITAHDPATGKELWRFEYWSRKVRDSRIIPTLVTGDGLIFGTRHKHKGVFALEPPAPWRGRPALASQGQLGLASPDHHTAVASEERGQDALATGERGQDALATGEQGQDALATEERGQDALATGRILWEFDEAAPDCSTPLFYEGRLYVLDGLKRKVVTCFEPRTGRQFWQGRLPGSRPWWASLTAADGKLYCINEDGGIVVLRAGGNEFEILFQTTIEEPGIKSSIAIAGGRLFIRTAENLYCIGE